MDVTEEMRAAVYTADCDRLGHIPDISQAISNDPGVNMIRIRAEDPSMLPHISCRRCGRVWLIAEESGQGYDDAIERRNQRVKPEFVRAPREPEPTIPPTRG